MITYTLPNSAAPGAATKRQLGSDIADQLFAPDVTEVPCILSRSTSAQLAPTAAAHFFESESFSCN
ncbi:hypothetical protein M378DRAFT_156655 [Amanita muscaria Koide BX008]|uniref:Uncharacterized protein n=1 Tax=Amanita muscaria (strain Koide BX008) TaxID=946122 RepID=A0A0C2X858_AMAMK|nr:hypothetical protein M378DRAFT_156655 [Amanita muscaria Koide BX008]